jgi:hypothetical protein
MDSKRCALRKLRGAFVNACKCVPHFAPNISIDICNFFFLICERKDVTFLLTLLPPFCSKNPPSTRELRRIATRKKREETDRLRKWRLFDSSAELWRVWWRFRGEFCAFKNDYLGRPFDFPFFFQREIFTAILLCAFWTSGGRFSGLGEKNCAGPMRKERRKRRRCKTCLTYACRWVVEVI